MIDMHWEKLELAVARVNKKLAPTPIKKLFTYMDDIKKKPTPINYFEWGNSKNETIICMGGVANSAMRFAFLAQELQQNYHVIAMDWAGRGDSGWLEELEDYTPDQAINQLTQLMNHLNKKSVHLIGSSLGGTIALSFASQNPKKVKTIVLNDIGPEMSPSRRKRRSTVLAKHYVFREFSDLERKVGASQKNDGIEDKDILLFNAYHLTKWSENEIGRIYKHDPRAMLAYKKYASKKLEQWAEWNSLHHPILLIRGALSDALTNSTVKKMLTSKSISLFKVMNAGHTPSLTTNDQINAITKFYLQQKI